MSTGSPCLPAIAELQQSGELSRRCQCRPCPYLNDVLERDHHFVKKRLATSLWFRAVDGALCTIAGYEAMNVIRKGQVRWLAKNDIVGQVRFIERAFGIAAQHKDGMCPAADYPLTTICDRSVTGIAHPIRSRH
jgi:hypothetical protein